MQSRSMRAVRGMLTLTHGAAPIFLVLTLAQGAPEDHCPNGGSGDSADLVTENAHGMPRTGRSA